MLGIQTWNAVGGMAVLAGYQERDRQIPCMNFGFFDIIQIRYKGHVYFVIYITDICTTQKQADAQAGITEFETESAILERK